MEAALSKVSKLDKNDDILFICLGKNGTSHQLGEGSIIYGGIELDPSRMALYYQAADVYLHASHGEVFGKTIAEAMACGVPVIATAVGGIPELVLDGITGFLVPPHDTDTMAREISKLLSDRNLHDQMARAANDCSMQRFNLVQQTDSFLNWYTEIMDNWVMWRSNALPNDK